eukprot:CAMPEP_0172454326 /NCGR_PEP_ID=MMETSP1065-20121228/11350_1 /TAXON_ID=265537 /ORGANISM="Amphiprora paludosa, Strain CCMP125" /LENGTH=203 /DNA_ID=CAMNT_0013206637 /DNA_START=678 /DNA_END=1286 /DNA_ORIENTATION=+
MLSIVFLIHHSPLCDDNDDEPFQTLVEYIKFDKFGRVDQTNLTAFWNAIFHDEEYDRQHFPHLLSQNQNKKRREPLLIVNIGLHYKHNINNAYVQALEHLLQMCGHANTHNNNNNDKNTTTTVRCVFRETMPQHFRSKMDTAFPADWKFRREETLRDCVGPYDDGVNSLFFPNAAHQLHRDLTRKYNVPFLSMTRDVIWRNAW